MSRDVHIPASWKSSPETQILPLPLHSIHPEPHGGILMLKKYDTANREGKFGQGYKQNLLLHFILISWMISGTMLLGARFNQELHLKNKEFLR